LNQLLVDGGKGKVKIAHLPGLMTTAMNDPKYVNVKSDYLRLACDEQHIFLKKMFEVSDDGKWYSE